LLVLLLFFTTFGGMVAGFVLCLFQLALLAAHLNNRPMITSIITHAVFVLVSPVIFLGIGLLGSLMGGRGGGPMGGGPEGPSFMGVLGILMAMGWVGWFIGNVLGIGSSLARARRAGRI
jgi:hypothetical protein